MDGRAGRPSGPNPHSFTPSLLYTRMCPNPHSFTPSLLYTRMCPNPHSFTPSLLYTRMWSNSFTPSLLHSFTPSLLYTRVCCTVTSHARPVPSCAAESLCASTCELLYPLVALTHVADHTQGSFEPLIGQYSEAKRHDSQQPFSILTLLTDWPAERNKAL
jgi:hypothetical protein